MKLKQPAAPFERLEFHGDSVSLDTEGKVLVLPTGNPHLLPVFNEYTLSRSGEVLEIGTYTLTDAELQYMIKPWIALYDPAKTVLNFFLFTHKPKKLQYVVSDIVSHVNFQTADGEIFTTSDGNDFLVMGLDAYITSLILYPGNGLIYHGQITYNDLTLDSNSDLIPDCINNFSYNFVTHDGNAFTTSDGAYFDFQTLVNGSITTFLQSYGMVI